MNVGKQFLQRLATKKGSISISVILWGVFFLFFSLVLAEAVYIMKEQQSLTYLTDDAVSMAVLYLDEDVLKEGLVQINEQQAKDSVIFTLNQALINIENPPSDSLLKEPADIEITVYNLWSEDGEWKRTEKAGDVLIHRPSVVLYAEYPVKSLFFPFSYHVHKIGIAQAQFRPVQGFK